MEKSTVYFIKDITPQNVVRAFLALNKPLVGRVAVKVHSGEEGNQNYLKPSFMKPLIDAVNGTVTECNTAYDGERNSTEKHRKLIKNHGWSELFDVDIMDADGDFALGVPNGLAIKKNYVGNHLKNYDSILVLSHFKGHPMGGYGGALKQLSIGCASSGGKAYIHSAGRTTDQYRLWDELPPQDKFLEAMADAASTVVNFFHGNAAYVNVMCNMSVDCDCCAIAEDPCMKDIGILASLDPVAVDAACLDLVKSSDDPGRDHLLERITSRHGEHTVDAAASLGIGSKEYNLITL